MEHIETKDYNVTEFIHSMRNVNRDASREKNRDRKNKKPKKELLKNKHRKHHDDDLENKGINIDVVIE